jgi:putative transposase
MRAGLDPFSFLVVSISGWINQRQQQLIEYRVEENRVLREQIGNRRMRFTDDQRRRLATRGKNPRYSQAEGREELFERS